MINRWRRMERFVNRFKGQLFFLLLAGIVFTGFFFLNALLQPHTNQRENKMNQQESQSTRSALRQIEDAAVLITESGNVIKLKLNVLKDILENHQATGDIQ